MPGRLTVVVVNLLANATLLWLGYFWLGLDESDSSHLLASFGLAALMVVGFSWLRGFSLVNFSGFSPRQAASQSLRALFPLTLLCLLAIAIYGLLAWVQAQYSQPAFVIASFLTLHLRKAIPPALVQNIFHFMVLTLEWGIVPAVLLRIALKIAGGPAANRSNAVRSSPLFAVLAAVLLICAIWIPLKLFYWVPDVTSFGSQLFSLILRVGVGYLLFVSGTLFLDFVTASGRPADTQPSTAPRP